MVRSTPQSGAEKWKNRLSGATAEIQAGVDRVTESPGVKAVAKNEKRKMRLAETEQKWKTNTAAVSAEDWKASMRATGISRIASGAAAKVGKYEKFASQFYPHLDAGSSKIKAMPDSTLEDRLARMVAMARHNHGFKRGG